MGLDLRTWGSMVFLLGLGAGSTTACEVERLPRTEPVEESAKGAHLEAEPMEDLLTEVRERYPEVPQLSPEALRAALGEASSEEAGSPAAPLVLDIREPKEFAVSHLPGARLAPDLESALEILQGEEKSRPVVVYCSVGYRSSGLAEELRERGFSDVKNLEGSIFAWANAGYPVVREGQPVREVHPYNRRWGRFLAPSLWAFEPGDGASSNYGTLAHGVSPRR